VPAALAAGAGRGWPALLGALALAGPHLLVHLVHPRGLGAGDAKLALGLGAAAGACGPDAWLLAALGAPLLTGLAAAVLLGLRGRARCTELPHGPSMCAATCLAVVAAVT
ncbi:prepilin peptidase, partial [Rhodococcus aerolatus]